MDAVGALALRDAALILTGRPVPMGMFAVGASDVELSAYYSELAYWLGIAGVDTYTHIGTQEGE